MKIQDILLRIAIGDAFGAGVEFQDRNWIREHVDFSKFVNVRNKIQISSDKIALFTQNYNEWDYTDDTEMTIGVIKSLLSNQDFSVDLLVDKWKEEYDLGIQKKGFGRNGHGSMSWYFSGEMTINQIRDFQRNRMNPGNAPAMRSIPLGLINEDLINKYAEINANATHPNLNAIISSQCIARSAEYLIVKQGKKENIIEYCLEKVDVNDEYKKYLKEVNSLTDYDSLTENDFKVLCGEQPIKAPYFLSGINGVPSDSKYTTGCVMYVLKNCTNSLDALKKSVNLGGDVDSVASICTGIMAGISGLNSLPEFMINNVEGKEYLMEIALKFEQEI